MNFSQCGFSQFTESCFSFVADGCVFLSGFNVVTVVFVCVVLDFLLFEGLGVCFPSLLLVRQGGFDEDK